MMEENKYYIPEIEDLSVGYECELNIPNLPDIKGGWKKISLTNETLNNYFSLVRLPSYKTFVRTKYLDKEDIESLGWKFDANKADDYKYYLNSYILYFPYAEEEPILIKDQKNTLFYGECKSINELKTIMKFLNIK